MESEGICRHCGSPQRMHRTEHSGNQEFGPLTPRSGKKRRRSRYIIDLNKKGKFLYSAVSNPQDSSKRFTHYFPGRPVQSNTISTSLGSIQPYATINTYIHHLSIARYSFIQLSELEQCRVKKLAQDFNTTAQDSTPGALSRGSDALPMSHHSHMTTTTIIRNMLT